MINMPWPKLSRVGNKVTLTFEYPSETWATRFYETLAVAQKAGIELIIERLIVVPEGEDDAIKELTEALRRNTEALQGPPPVSAPWSPRVMEFLAEAQAFFDGGINLLVVKANGRSAWHTDKIRLLRQVINHAKEGGQPGIHFTDEERRYARALLNKIESYAMTPPATRSILTKVAGEPDTAPYDDTEDERI